MRRPQLGLTDSHGRDQDRELGYIGRGARPQRRDQLSEAFDPGFCTTCSEYGCKCVCAECQEQTRGVRSDSGLCAKCHDIAEIVRERQLEREHRESFDRVADLATQLEMIGAL